MLFVTTSLPVIALTLKTSAMNTLVADYSSKCIKTTSVALLSNCSQCYQLLKQCDSQRDLRRFESRGCKLDTQSIAVSCACGTPERAANITKGNIGPGE